MSKDAKELLAALVTALLIVGALLFVLMSTDSREDYTYRLKCKDTDHGIVRHLELLRGQFIFERLQENGTRYVINADGCSYNKIDE